MATAAVAGHLSDSLVGHPHCSLNTTTTIVVCALNALLLCSSAIYYLALLLIYSFAVDSRLFNYFDIGSLAPGS